MLLLLCLVHPSLYRAAILAPDPSVLVCVCVLCVSVHMCVCVWFVPCVFFTISLSLSLSILCPPRPSWCCVLLPRVVLLCMGDLGEVLGVTGRGSLPFSSRCVVCVGTTQPFTSGTEPHPICSGNICLRNMRCWWHPHLSSPISLFHLVCVCVCVCMCCVCVAGCVCVCLPIALGPRACSAASGLRAFSCFLPLSLSAVYACSRLP
jgi:hypothetical protein